MNQTKSAFTGRCSNLWILFLAMACTGTGHAAASDPLESAYARRDYFALRELLSHSASDAASPRRVFLRAAVATAFAHHEQAANLLSGILSAPLPDPSLEFDARELLMLNERAVFHYRAALAAIAPVLQHPSPGAESVRDNFENLSRLLNAIVDVRAQTAEISGRSILPRGRDGRFPAQIDGFALSMGFDTGANFSFLARSVALAAGLEIRPASLRIGSSTGHDITADMAVGDVTFGSVRLHRVVFLIMPDAVLTMPDGFVMKGLLGFPVIAALGPLHYRADGTIEVGAPAPQVAPNLALQRNDVLLRVKYGTDFLVCRLDTGADESVFYEPFVRRHPELLADPARAYLLKLGGAAGAHEIPALHLDPMVLGIAGQTVVLHGTSAMTKPIVPADQNFLDGNLGRDAFAGAAGYTLDLDRLTLEIDPEPK